LKVGVIANGAEFSFRRSRKRGNCTRASINFILDSTLGSRRSGIASSIFRARGCDGVSISVCPSRIIKVTRISRIALEVAALTLNVKLVAAVLFFGPLGALLTFGFGKLAKAVHADAITFVLGAEAFAKGTKKTATAGCEEGIAKIRQTLGLLVFQFTGHPPA
jgi:hypothetical protein